MLEVDSQNCVDGLLLSEEKRTRQTMSTGKMKETWCQWECNLTPVYKLKPLLFIYGVTVFFFWLMCCYFRLYLKVLVSYFIIISTFRVPLATLHHVLSITFTMPLFVMFYPYNLLYYYFTELYTNILFRLIIIIIIIIILFVTFYYETLSLLC